MADFFPDVKKMIVLSTVLLVVCSCEKKPEFTQLKKDWHSMVEERFSADTDSAADALPETKIADSSKGKSSHPVYAAAQNSVPKQSGNVRSNLVQFAKQFIGTPYIYGNSSPETGFDCSGFINYIYKNFGYEVPRTTTDFEFFGKEIPAESGQPGDLVLFTGTDQDTTGNHIGHIGIIIDGNGMKSDFIHASSGKANGVTISSLSSPHYTGRFVKVISVLK